MVDISDIFNGFPGGLGSAITSASAQNLNLSDLQDVQRGLLEVKQAQMRDRGAVNPPSYIPQTQFKRQDIVVDGNHFKKGDKFIIPAEVFNIPDYEQFPDSIYIKYRGEIREATINMSNINPDSHCFIFKIDDIFIPKPKEVSLCSKHLWK